MKRPFWGRGVSLIPCFSTDETLGTEYDIHLLCAMIADHVTLPAILCFIFGRQDALKKVAISQKKLPYCFQFFGNLLVPELIIKG